jgi:hypothetical protein
VAKQKLTDDFHNDLGRAPGSHPSAAMKPQHKHGTHAQVLDGRGRLPARDPYSRPGKTLVWHAVEIARLIAQRVEERDDDNREGPSGEDGPF